MATTLIQTEEPFFVIHFGPYLQKLNDDEFFEFCQLNRDLRIERTSEGDVIVMPPTGSKSGSKDFELAGQFSVWAKRDGTGTGFGSSTGFKLPNGAVRSPDLAWIGNDRWNALSKEQQKTFAPICPDFVVEMRSPTDQVSYLKAKMIEYLENGAQLGWLIDPIERTVRIYRPNQEVEYLKEPLELSGEGILKGFTLDLLPIWE